MVTPPKRSGTGGSPVSEESVRRQQPNIGVGLDDESSAEVTKGRDAESGLLTIASCDDDKKSVEGKATDVLFNSPVLDSNSDCTERTASLTAVEHVSSDNNTCHVNLKSSVTNATAPTASDETYSTAQLSSQDMSRNDRILANNNPNPSSGIKLADATCTWHYFEVKWQTEFISSFGETCLPSSKTAPLLLPDGSPLNKAHNWQELSADVGALVCSFVDEMHASLVDKRRKLEEAKLAAKPPPFIRVEGDVQESADWYWRCIVGKVERELGRVHLACPFGSQRSVSQ